ncbi:MAG: Sua5/YciO/YrdC/YwlC family protein [Thiomargarita sp.]|nr:Sua5/YciO/YrdC/YwlC family protein [Thiomargarita sp.]
MNNWHLKKATYHLNKGRIIAYPTEAVYGLGCNPLDRIAVNRLLELKQRKWQKGLILIAANYQQLIPFIQILPTEIENKILASWINPITWLLPAKSHVPYWLRGKSDKLAVRVTTHQQANKLCQYFGGALVSTSANISNHPAAKTDFKVRQIFHNKLDYILSGQIGEQERPTEIRDALTDKILRV